MWHEEKCEGKEGGKEERKTLAASRLCHQLAELETVREAEPLWHPSLGCQVHRSPLPWGGGSNTSPLSDHRS